MLVMKLSPNFIVLGQLYLQTEKNKYFNKDVARYSPVFWVKNFFNIFCQKKLPDQHFWVFQSFVILQSYVLEARTIKKANLALLAIRKTLNCLTHYFLIAFREFSEKLLPRKIKNDLFCILPKGFGFCQIREATKFHLKIDGTISLFLRNFLPRA